MGTDQLNVCVLDVATPLAAKPSTPAAVSGVLRASLIPFIIGAVLVAAGILKTEKLWAEGSSEESLLGSWGLITIIELELGLGLALAANLWPRLLRRIAIVLFAGFTGVALSKAAAAERSCSCAGNLSISPILAVVVDVCILAALWRWQAVSRRGRTWLMAAFSVSLLAVAPWPLLAAFRPPAYPRLVVTPVIDLGQLAPGERRDFTLRVRNPHDQAVEIAALESSCPCLEGRGVPSRVAPGERQTLHMTLNLSREPAFSGPICVGVTGRRADGDIAFATEVRTVVGGRNQSAAGTAGGKTSGFMVKLNYEE